MTFSADLASRTTSDFTFDDGSVLVVGDNSTAVTNDDAVNTLTSTTQSKMNHPNGVYACHGGRDRNEIRVN